MKVFSVKSKNLIKKAVGLLREGKVLVFPTDTVYGLLGNAANQSVVEKVYKIKKREFQKPIPIFVADLKMAEKIVEISGSQKKFLAEVWPGKVTVVMKKRKKSILSSNSFFAQETIGLRIPDYPLLNKILKLINLPLTGTSANISGQSSLIDSKEALSQFQNNKYQPDILVDGGKLKTSLPSTVVDLTENTPKVLREGEIKKEKVLEIFNR